MDRTLGSFTTVDGIRYEVIYRKYPKDKIVWEGGPVGGRVYPVDGDRHYTHKAGYFVSHKTTMGKSFPTFLEAARYAQDRQRKEYEANKAAVAAYEGELT